MEWLKVPTDVGKTEFHSRHGNINDKNDDSFGLIKCAAMAQIKAYKPGSRPMSDDVDYRPNSFMYKEETRECFLGMMHSFSDGHDFERARLETNNTNYTYYAHSCTPKGKSIHQ